MVGDEETEELFEGEAEEVRLLVAVREGLEEEDELADTELEGVLEGETEEVALPLEVNDEEALALPEEVAESVID